MILKYSWIKMNYILKEKLLKFISIKFHLDIDMLLFLEKIMKWLKKKKKMYFKYSKLKI